MRKTVQTAKRVNDFRAEMTVSSPGDRGAPMAGRGHLGQEKAPILSQLSEQGPGLSGKPYAFSGRGSINRAIPRWFGDFLNRLEAQ